jgi:DNA-binding MarR family transcriptional regulator
VASRQVAALVGAGYVERETDPDDGRAHRLRTSESGARALQDAHRRLVETATEALAGWPDAEIAALATRLERLREDFAATEGTRP